ncbi:ATP-binding protein, partial [Pseudomonadota bacterium]
MVKRKIIKIDENLCNGCGICIPNCPEGALQIIENKARLISDLFCDGLGACIGDCPQEAITIEEREAEPYDEIKVLKNIIKQGSEVVKAHLQHLEEHGETKFLKQAKDYLEENNISIPDKLPCGCAGSKVMFIVPEEDEEVNIKSQLRQWPIQLHLLPVQAPFFDNSDLIVIADCVGFVNPNLHQELIKGKSIAIGCPKLDDVERYQDKI